MIRRTYRCDTCEHEFTHDHANSDEPYPECPKCAETVAWMPKSFGVKTNKSRAMDMTQNMMESMGYTDFSDNQRAGDIAVKGPPPIQGAERDALNRELFAAGLPTMTPEQTQLAGDFWQNAAGNTGHGASPYADACAAAVAQAPAAAAAARNDGVDPISLLNAPGRPGMKLDVVSKVKAS
jgi:DNA-directed RNA polymerase subunit RPC12/RpoP